MSTEADALRRTWGASKRTTARWRADLLAWLLGTRRRLGWRRSREAECRRRRERRFAPSGASVKASARAQTASPPGKTTRFPRRPRIRAGRWACPCAAAATPTSRAARAPRRRAPRRRAPRRARARSSVAGARARRGVERGAPRARRRGGHWRESTRAGGTRSCPRGGTRRGARRAEPSRPRRRTLESVVPADRPTPATRLASAQHHDRLMERAEGRRARTPERKSEKKTDTAGTDVAGAAGATDDEAEQRRVPSLNRMSLPAPLPIAPPPITSEPTVPVTNSSSHELGGSATETAERVAAVPRRARRIRRPRLPPVNRVLDLEAPRDALPEGKTKAPTAGCRDRRRRWRRSRRNSPSCGGWSLRRRARSRASSRRRRRRRLRRPRRRSTARSAADAVDRGRSRTFGTSPSFRVRRRRNPNPSRWSICGPSLARSRAEPWSPPPPPPKTKWKRNSLDRDAVAALKKETIKAREEKARAEPMNLTRQNAFAPDRDAKAPARGGKAPGAGRASRRRRRRPRRRRSGALCSRARISRSNARPGSVQEGQSRGEGETEGTRTRTSRRGTVMTEAWCAELATRASRRRRSR